MTLPLADVRIIAVEQYGAGPWATLQLADLGAEVIKIEDPASSGDVGRYVPPYADGEDSLFFETFNRNKKSVSLDLRSPRGREVFETLVAKSDAVYSNLRGDQPAQAADHLRRPARGQPADRLLLAVGLRDDRPAGRAARLRLHHAGDGRLDEPDRRPGRAADQERPVARRPLRRLRFGDRAARRPVARAPRRRRLRLRHLAVRDRAARARVRRHLGGDARAT